MSSADSVLTDLFATTDSERWRKVFAPMESSPGLSWLAEKISGQTDFMNWSAAFKEISGKIPDLLRIDVAKVLVGAWKKGEELRRYADAEKYPAQETIFVELTEHTVSSTHKPHLDILINERPVGRIDFQVKLALIVRGAILNIRDGKIWEATTGSCHVSGEIKCEGHSIMKKESEPLDLPGTLIFKKPIQIASPARDGRRNEENR